MDRTLPQRLMTLPENFSHYWAICHFTRWGERHKSNDRPAKPLLLLGPSTRGSHAAGPDHRHGQRGQQLAPRPHSGWAAQPELPRCPSSHPSPAQPSPPGKEHCSQAVTLIPRGLGGAFLTLRCPLHTQSPSPHLPALGGPSVFSFMLDTCPVHHPPPHYMSVSQCYSTWFSFASPHKEWLPLWLSW